MRMILKFQFGASVRIFLISLTSLITISGIPVGANPSKNWQYIESKDPFTDKVGYSVMRLSETDEGAMAFLCEEGQPLGVIISWGKAIVTSATNKTIVEFRQGSAPMFSIEWDILESEERNTSVLENGGQSMLNHIALDEENAPMLLARTSGDLSNAFQEFDTNGLREAITQVTSHCSYE